MAEVSPQFARAPQNPNLQAQTSPAGESPSPASPTASQPAVPPAQGADDKLQSWLNVLNSSTQEQASEQAPPVPATPTLVQTPEPPKQVVSSVPPTPAPEWAAQLNDVQQQNRELQARLQQQNEVIQNLMQSKQDYEQLKTQIDANNIQFGELATVEADDAKSIAAGIMKAVGAQLEPIKQALYQQQQNVQQSNQWQEQRFMQQKAQDTIRRIMEKHPDFVALQQDPNYLQFVQQRPGASSLSYDALAAYEFQQGNAGYIIDLIDRYKQTVNKPADITSVAPVSTATGAAPARSQEPPLPTLQELNQWMQMRRITQDQYRQLLQKVLSASQKG